MPRAIFLLISIICLMPQSVLARPKIGLVLSGGGARGGAHLGVIKVLEENKTPIDAIVERGRYRGEKIIFTPCNIRVLFEIHKLKDCNFSKSGGR